MGVGMSEYFRKYPSMSCTSERHIPQARTWTSTSSGLMSGIGTSSRTRALPYSCMRAAFMSAFLSKWWVFKILVSLGGWWRSVFGDDHHLLVDKFLDAVLWGYPLLLPIVSLGSLATR